MKPSEEIVRFFEKDRFAAETGAVIDEIDDRYARCSLTLEAVSYTHLDVYKRQVESFKSALG